VKAALIVIAVLAVVVVALVLEGKKEQEQNAMQLGSALQADAGAAPANP